MNGGYSPPVMPTDATAEPTTKAAKIPTPVHTFVHDVADECDGNGHVVLTAMTLCFQGLTPARRKRYLDEAKRMYPLRHHRVGRGNRVRKAG